MISIRCTCVLHGPFCSTVVYGRRRSYPLVVVWRLFGQRGICPLQAFGVQGGDEVMLVPVSMPGPASQRKIVKERGEVCWRGVACVECFDW